MAARVPLRWSLILAASLILAPLGLVLGVGVLLGSASLPAFGLAGLPALPILGGVALAAALPTAGCVGLVLTYRRRFGLAELKDDVLEVVSPAVPGPFLPARDRVPLLELEGLEPTPHGVIARAPWRGWFAETFRPLFIPVADEARREALLSDLNRRLDPDPEGRDQQASYGQLPPPWLTSALVLALLLSGAVPLGLVALRLGPLYALILAPLVFLAHAGAIALVDGVLIEPRFRRLHVGRQALLIGSLHCAWEDLVAVAPAPPFLALETTTRKLLVRLDQALPQALGHLGERLEPQQLLALAPAWAAPPARRRRAGLALGVASLVLLAGLAAGLSHPALHGEARLIDAQGRGARLIYRLSDRRPRLVILLDPPSPRGSLITGRVWVPGLIRQRFGFERDWQLILASGEGRRWGQPFRIPPGATWVHLDPGGQTSGQQLSLPERLPAGLLDVPPGTVVGSLPRLLAEAGIPLPERWDERP